MERFFSGIKNKADKVAKKSGELVELSKAKLNILSTKSNIDTSFKSLGKSKSLLEDAISQINANYYNILNNKHITKLYITYNFSEEILKKVFTITKLCAIIKVQTGNAPRLVESIFVSREVTVM